MNIETDTDSVLYWRRRHEEAIDRWARLDSLLTMLKRENDLLREELKRARGEA